MKFGRTEIITLILILIAVAGAVYLAYRVTEEKKEISSDAGQTLNDKNSDSQFTSLEGEPFSFDTYNGKVRVVNVWATWTPFSKDELVVLNNLAQQYSNQDIVFLAINRMESAERVKSYISHIGQLDSITFVQDMTDIYYKRIEGFSMPETIIYNNEGDIIVHKRGPMKKEELQTEINNALATEE